jgi:L-iditol 2-dehydrogenase
MKKAVMTEPGMIRFDEVDLPTIKGNQALVKIYKLGICGSDVHVYYGKHPFTKYPVVQGHEVSGEVITIGTDVKKVKAGDRVIIRPQIVCGVCRQCLDGNYNICDDLKVLGFQIDGAGAEYYVADEECMIKMPDKMSYEGGALVEPLAVGTHAIKRAGGVAGLNILIIGAGPIGNLTAQAAKAKGAAAVMISDKSEFRLQLAGDCNVDFLHNVDTEELEKKLIDDFGKDKADIIFDCVGTEASLRACILNARKGTKIITVGVYEGEIKADISKVQDRELKLIGTLMYKEEDMIEAINLISSGKIDYKKIITKEVPFSEYLEAYQHLEKNRNTEMKIIIDIAGNL